MRGYKAFNKDWTCRNKQYQVGETFTEDVDLSVCERGMHFCERLPQVFNFYQTVVVEVEALGDVNTDEVQKICNTGDCNTGDCNTGNRNTGDCNTGNRNTGNRNQGMKPLKLMPHQAEALDLTADKNHVLCFIRHH